MSEPGSKDSLRSDIFVYLLCCAGLFTTLSSATAQELPGIELEWTAPRECPSREAVLHNVLSRSTERRAVVPLRASAKIMRHGASYRLELVVNHREGSAHRALESTRCAALAEAAAVLIVLALESEQAVEPSSPPIAAAGSESTPASAGGPSTDVSPANAAPEEAPQTAPSSPEDTSLEITHEDPSKVGAKRTLHLQLSAAARADFGTFPHQPAWGVQAQVAARIKPLYIALGATYWPAREQRSVSYPNARLRGSGVFGDLSLGMDVSAEPVVLTPALHAELGLLYAEAVGIAGPERNRVVWFAFGPSLSAAVNILTDLWMAFDVAGLIPAYQTHWLVRTPEGDVPAFDAAPLVLRTAVRIGYNL